ncbi:MAG: hypothetical protein CM15mP93_03400 [Thiotrichaceae bacterium]|nr:MAG: hypothetical protein CM15mP93_03400 [Thiotrichaceae bacterium]
MGIFKSPSKSKRESNLEDLKTAVLKNKCDLGLAFDGDGDRCLIVDDCGNSLWPDKQMMIFLHRFLNIILMLKLFMM